MVVTTITSHNQSQLAEQFEGVFDRKISPPYQDPLRSSSSPSPSILSGHNGAVTEPRLNSPLHRPQPTQSKTCHVIDKSQKFSSPTHSLSSINLSRTLPPLRSPPFDQALSDILPSFPSLPPSQASQAHNLSFLSHTTNVAAKGRRIDSTGLGRVGTAGRERVDIARLTTQGVGRANNILQGQQRVGRTDNARGPGSDARIRFGGTKIVMGGGEVSVGLVRRRETLRRLKDQGRTDIRDISKAVVGRALGQDCRRARQRHTEVRSSYHFRVGSPLKTKKTPYILLNKMSNTPPLELNLSPSPSLLERIEEAEEEHKINFTELSTVPINGIDASITQNDILAVA
ncbi:hypothetical protein BY996DRAFT_8464734 [Phakopsora pachyrhizi]|nr:hypothetical protein BY996DRAFT_8464734 [Phakopsora pachyrhizi]